MVTKVWRNLQIGWTSSPEPCLTGSPRSEPTLEQRLGIDRGTPITIGPTHEISELDCYWTTVKTLEATPLVLTTMGEGGVCTQECCRSDNNEWA